MEQQEEGTLGPPFAFSGATIRLYTSDLIILSLLERNGYGYSRSIAARLNRAHRTITKHLRKLERLHLVRRHGRIRCCFQWWSVNELAKETVRAVLKAAWTKIKGLAAKTYNYLVVKILPVQVRKRPLLRLQLGEYITPPIPEPRQYHGDERPAGASIPFKCYCERGGACPFPVCIKHLNPRDHVEAAILDRARRFILETLYPPP